jgi:methionyl aminopeptidase
MLNQTLLRRSLSSLNRAAHVSSILSTASTGPRRSLTELQPFQKQATQHLHSSSLLFLPRKPRNAHGGGNLRNHFGNYTRLAPTSLRLGVVPPDVGSLVPGYIQQPSYALRGEPSEWAASIPIHGVEEIEKSRRAGQLAKKILELGGTLVKVIMPFLKTYATWIGGGECLASFISPLS